MSVRTRKWIDTEGKEQEAYVIDVKYRHPDGRVERIQRKCPVQTRRGAEAYERQIRQALLDGTFERAEEVKPEPAVVPTFRYFVARFLEYSRTNNKNSSVAAKQNILDNHLMPFFGDMPLDQIQLKQIEEFKTGMKAKGTLGRNKDRPLSAKTINNSLTVLRKLLSLAVEQEVIQFIPKVRWLKSSAPDFDFLSFEETEALIAGTEPEWRTLILTALKTGMRIGELLALQWGDVDLASGYLTVKRRVWRGILGIPKGGRHRRIPLTSSLAKALEAKRGALSTVHRFGPQFVFCGEDRSMLTAGQLKWPLYRALANAGIHRAQGRIGWHDLRHTFASHLVMRGTPLSVVQELLGHATIDMTAKYAHLSPDAGIRAIERLDSPEGNMRVTQTVLNR